MRAFYRPEAAKNTMGLPSVFLPLLAAQADLHLLHSFKPRCLSIQASAEAGLSPEQGSTLLDLKHHI